jgi:hypothetical protein
MQAVSPLLSIAIIILCTWTQPFRDNVPILDLAITIGVLSPHCIQVRTISSVLFRVDIETR